MKSFSPAALVFFCVATSLSAQSFHSGKNSFELRGEKQQIYSYPAPAGAKPLGTVLFLPGDGGWRGDVIDMAREVAKAGYSVYGWDIKDYLKDFTGKTTLTEPEMAADIATVTKRVAQEHPGKVSLVGWSQGAGMVVLGAADPKSQDLYQGVVTLGLPEKCVLGWRWIDDLTYITHGEPNEPMFSVTDSLPHLAPLRFADIIATGDPDTPLDAAKKLYAEASDPKRDFIIDADGHDFGSNRSGLYDALDKALAWIRN